MERARGSEIREDIAEALDVGAALLTRHLARGTSLTARAVLATLDEEGPTRLTALASATGASQPATTQLVGRLERDGLLDRLVDPDDARATLVAITDVGRALRSELRQSQHERLGELLDVLSVHDQVTLSLAMRAALPLLRQLTRHAAENPQPQQAPASLTT
ncbi:DNA-binding MarR family transcriptional regulator [Nocardia sp. GAS34]|uniref:MarR family winged helix-turn-helix transcriptional regulator n=1 Tax=unclassified Nocardia TaxID=2637762 RepID=UPI003D1B37ED